MFTRTIDTGHELAELSEEEWLSLNLSEFITRNLSRYVGYVFKKIAPGSRINFQSIQSEDLHGMIYIQLIETLPKYFHKAAPNVPVEGRAKMLNGYVFRILETRLIASMGDIELFLQYPDSPDNGSDNLDTIDSEGFIDGFLTRQGLLDRQEDVAFAADAETEKDERAQELYQMIEIVRPYLTRSEYRVLRLKIIEGFDKKQLGEVLSADHSQVRRLLAEARRKLLELCPETIKDELTHLAAPRRRTAHAA